MKPSPADNPLRGLPLAKAPDSIWTAIEAALDAENLPRPMSRHPYRQRLFWAWGFASAAVALLTIVFLAWRSSVIGKPTWAIVRLDGQPVVGSKALNTAGRIAVGEWLQTDGKSRARIAVGAIGTVEVAPNTRLRVLASRPQEQRLQLATGEISASVSAPPRLFFVDMPASTAVDLGCAYTMKTQPDGTGLLRVTLGWVSLEWHGRESLVPAGASCRTHSKLGPGTPYFDDASERLQNALSDLDLNPDNGAALSTALTEARVRDTLSLWHLLSRVTPASRELVYDRLTALAPPPQDVSRDQVLQLDPPVLKHLREELAWKW